ncbi:MAG: hypothetical protein GC138_03330 [Gammaproteobacteria bacterium]|nr:hypothetical protein [Gammaproteobacteria bacterium]
MNRLIFQSIGSSLLLTLLVAACSCAAHGDQTIEWSDNGRSFKLQLRGDVSYADDDAGIASISPGGYFLLKKNDGVTRRRVLIRPAGSTNLDYSYSFNGRAAPWDESAQSWFAQSLREAVREFALGARQRVRRLRQRSGPEGVLQEISLIKNDGAKRAYFEELFSSGPLDDPSLLKAAARQIAREIRSDGDKSAVLVRIFPEYAENADLQEPYFAAVQTIHSDGDCRRVLESALKHHPRADGTLARVFDALRTVSSDGDKSAVLIAGLRGMPAETESADRAQLKLLESVNTIRSDGDRRRVFSEFLESHELSANVWPRALESIRRISSDGDKSAVLVLAARRLPDDETVQLAYAETASTIHSSGDWERTTLAFLDQHNLAPAVRAKIKTTASHRGSHDRVLMKIADLENQ